VVVNELKDTNDSLNLQVEELGQELLEISCWADCKGIKINKAVENKDGTIVRAEPIMYKLPHNISTLDESKLDGEDSILERSLQRSLKKPITQNVKHR